MKNIRTIIFYLSVVITASTCQKAKKSFDASGSFEAEEYIISAEASGVIRELNLNEGQYLDADSVVGYVDSTQLFLRKKQLLAQINAILSKKPDVSIQLAALYEQLKNAEKEKERTQKLIQGDAATKKQLDDIQATIDILKKQIDAQKSSLSISTEGINQETLPLHIQIEQIEDQLAKCKIINPINGTVLNKYAKAHEITAVGKPLYKIADISTIVLRAYISGSQLPEISLNQQVTILTDNEKGGYNEDFGTITWISDKAEFTPKTIQTKEERTNAVYAIKISVKNNGRYKIGMYGEIKFNKK